MPKLISKFLRVATEGPTVDGRTITADQIEKMASSYDPKTYSARIWIEHFRSILPDGAFQPLGDVVALKAERADGKMALFARLRPNERLLKMNKDDNKVYTSIEMLPDFAKTGEPYMMGLAVTDTPASLGTDRLEFAQQGITKFADGDDVPATIICPAVDAGRLEFSEEAETPDQGPGLFAQVKDLLNGTSKRQDARFSDIEKSVVTIAEGMDALGQKFAVLSATNSSDQPKDTAALETKLEALSTQFSELVTKITGEPNPDTSPRPEAKGFNAERKRADC